LLSIDKSPSIKLCNSVKLFLLKIINEYVNESNYELVYTAKE